MKTYIGTAIALLIYLVLDWFLGSWLQLQGPDLWILRGGLALIGLAAALAFLWFYVKRSGGTTPKRSDSEIDVVIREAEARLKSSNLGRTASLKNLPVVFVVGGPGAAKTSIMAHSGLEAELLSGVVYQDNNIIPTRWGNFWYAKNTVFVDTVGKAASDTSLWQRLLKSVQSGKLQSLRGGNAPRAAVVCFSCENFLQPAGETLSAGARNIRACLDQIAKHLGISVPVYVLFTKADRIPFFAEFTARLSNDEVSRVLGVTLPFSAPDSGVYAEQQGQRLNATFNNLALSLGEKRVELLAREYDAQKLGGVYEFPREFRKLRSSVASFLLDICRPSPLTAAPFLRGFYFSGARAVIVNEVTRPAPTPAAPPAAGFSAEANATRIFKAGQGPSSRAAIPEPQIVGSRKLPQWTFLTHFFSDVLLQDRLAMAAAGGSVKTSTLRRVLLSTGILVCLLLTLALTISYFGNRALERDVIAAAQAASAEPAPSPAQFPAALTQLDTLRQAMERLSQYRREGAPLRLKWGLYMGENLYDQSRDLYFRRFRQLLFGSTQSALVDFLKRLPSSPGPGDDYGLAYDSLKAYLITTSNHDKSTQMFLSPVLFRRWSERQTADPATLALAQKQFDFYSEELKTANPYSSENDAASVERTRRYISQFAGPERVYQFMLTEAAQKKPNIAFNRDFPGSADVVIDAKEVSAAYSKTGFIFMQDAIKNADRFFSGEEWVLGRQALLGVDRKLLEQQLSDRYTADFIAQWQQFVRAASIVRYTSVKDASAKLNKLSSNQSPLLAVFCVLSQNTAVESPQIKAAFQPVQFVVPPGCAEKYIGDSNMGYINALIALNALIEQIANTPAGSADALTGQALSSATQAKVATRQAAQNFRIDPQTHLESAVQKLMEDPIVYVESIIRNVGPAELNGKGRALCTQFGELTTKYPFNANSGREATIQEINAIFQPQQGAMWTFYDSNLKNQLLRQGSQFVVNPAGGITLNPAFLTFWNRAAQFADAVYPDNSAQPRLSYTLKPYRIEGIENVSLSIDGQTISTAGANPAARQFVWTGNANSEVKLTGAFGRGAELAFASYSGLWAVFQFFADADRWTTSGTLQTLEWVPRQGRGGRPMTLPNGTPLSIRFDLDMGRAAPVFQKSFLAGLTCVSEIAR